MATRISERSRRAVNPCALARIVNQVGSPWMLDGKRFFPPTGMPMRNRARRMAIFDVWLPEPLTVATTIENSLRIGGRSTGEAPAPCAATAGMLIGQGSFRR